MSRSILHHSVPTKSADPATRPTPRIVTEAIAGALHDDATSDVDNIRVVCDDADIWLSGHVQSWAARCHAERAAWTTPGVRFVHNDIRINVPNMNELP